MTLPTQKPKPKDINRLYDNYRKQRIERFLPNCEVPTMSAVEPSIHGKDNHAVASFSHGSISVIGRQRAMEDAMKVLPGFLTADHSGGYDFFAVYDGYAGTVVSNACRERLHFLLAEQVEEEEEEGGGRGKRLDWHKLMRSCFMKLDKEIGSNEAEEYLVCSAAAVVVVGREELVVANGGESRVVLCRGGVALPFSRNLHKGDDKEKVQAAAAVPMGERCYMKPEVNVWERRDSDEFIVIGSDGLWEVVSQDLACELVRRCLNGEMKTMFKEGFDKSCAAEAAAALLAELALSRGSNNNITVIVVQLNNSN